MENIIEVKNITKTYKTGPVEYKALKGISFVIKKGEMVGIMGPSGSGKSTTMHILGALDTLDTGVYKLNNIEIKDYSKDKLAEIRNKEIGFVFQFFNLLPRASIFKNVELPLIYRGISKKERTDLAIKALDEVGLKDRADSMPNQLSGGQQQRVAIARAIAGDPSIILADEPTGNLDSQTSFDIMRQLQQMNKEGKTIILITHEHDIANCCKRIIHLKDGLVLSDQVNKEFNVLIN